MRPIPSLSRKLVSASSFAIATAMLAQAPAQAQSFDATVVGTFGATVTVNDTVPGITSIDVDGDTAVINWQPNNAGSGPIIFQPASTTATFTRTSPTGLNFSVLNRIIPSDQTRPIQFNGTVNSELIVSGSLPGGNIFFYSPGGIILGATANFDVGSLALTTLDLEYDTGGGNFGSAGTYSFNPLASSTTNPLVPDSKVRILSGAQVNTTVINSYVALVAPSVTNDGTITVDDGTQSLGGSVALVAADAATINFSPSGLFNIQVTSGTSSTGTVVSNSGTITGPLAGINDNRRIYMVAVPKNDAITMAIGAGSSLGFDIAGAANVTGNTIILSGGYDVNVGVPSFTPSVGGGTGQVSVTGGDADITSSLFASVTGGVNLGSNLAGGLNFASDVSIISAGASSSLFANTNGSLTVAGDVNLNGDHLSGLGPSVGNDVAILANGGSVTLNSNVSLSSLGRGANAFIDATTAGTGTGGTVRIEATNGGQITIQGDVTADASGIGGDVSAATGGGGVGLGGSIFIRSFVASGSAIQISGDANLVARGDGGAGLFCSTCLPVGGNATGGDVTIFSSAGNSVSVSGAIDIDASGNGGDANGTGVLAGSGTGGTAFINSSFDGQLILHSVDVIASGVGGDALSSGTAGSGLGGAIQVTHSGGATGSSAFNGAVSLTADGIGGQGLSGGDAGDGAGGNVFVSANAGSTIDFTDLLIVSASGTGGSGLSGSSIGTGGSAVLNAQNAGQVSVTGLTTIFADGTGGNVFSPLAAATSTGGTAQIFAGPGGIIELQSNVLVRARGEGRTVSLDGQAGAGVGGNASIVGDVGSIFSTVGNASIVADGTGGDALGSPVANIQGGNGTGGNALFQITGGLATVGGDLTINAFGVGGLGSELHPDGTGGIGDGGFATLSAGFGSLLGSGASINVSGQVNVDASGAGGGGFIGGAGIGGESSIAARQGSLTLGIVGINAEGSGGNGTSNGTGGAGTGGNVVVVAQNALEGPSQIQTGQLMANASAFGGTANDPDASNTPGGNGGSAQGGSVLVAGSAGNGSLQAGAVSLLASAFGGAGGLGNDASGGNGGNASGGFIQIGVISGIDTGSINLGSATFTSIASTANATGGNGGFVVNPVVGANGGNGGNATGGGGTLIVRGAPVTINGLATFQSNATGGDGGSGDVNGNGGNAAIGNPDPQVIAGSSALVTSRFNQPSQRGSLTAQNLVFGSTTAAGSGTIDGTESMIGGAATFVVKDSDLTASNISLFALTGTSDSSPTAAVNAISLINSTANVSGLFQLNTSSATSLQLDQSTLSAVSVAIQAANWVYDPVLPGTLGTVEAIDAITFTSSLNLVAQANVSAGDPLTLSAVGQLDLGSASSNGYVFASAGSDMSFDDVSAGDYILLSAGGTVTTNNLLATSFVSIEAHDNITTGIIAAGDGIPRGPAAPTGAVELNAGGTISTGAITTPSYLTAIAGQSLTIGQSTATDMLLLSGSSVSTGGLDATGRVLIANESMQLLGDVDRNLVFAASTITPTPGAISISAPVTAATFTAVTQSSFTSDSITAQSAVSGEGNVLINAGGAVATGRLTSNAQAVKVVSFGSTVLTGNINAPIGVLVSAPQSVTIGGAINSRDVVLLSGNNLSTGQIFAGLVTNATGQVINATGRILVANNSMATDSLLRSNSADYSALFAAPPVPVGGTVNIAGTAIAGQIVSFSQGSMTGNTLVAFGSIEVESGGLVTVAQRWGAQSVDIASVDIRIIDNGTVSGAQSQAAPSGIRTTPTGNVDLVSIGGAPALIGDGLSGSGYALSAAELALITTSDLSIAAVDIATNQTDMLIGNLSLTAGGDIGSSNLAGATGRIFFATGNRATQIPGGAIRIVGNVSGSGFGATNVVEFATGRFELDAATGSLSLTQSGTTLGGIVEISADNIHVASGTILDRLAADPFYTGVARDLNSPAAVQRPEGVLRALGLNLFPTGTLYIQNTGTSLNPAGFFADFDETDLTPPDNAADASIAVIVNGQWQTPTGIVGGTDARDLVVNNADTLVFYTANSSVNGCAISATACVPDESVDPTPAIQGQISIISDNTLGSTPEFAGPASNDTDAGSDDEQTAEEAVAEAASEAEDATSPIAPPPQIIDSKPLETKSTIEQPVAGSGNPSLIGSVVNENSAEGEAQ